MIEPHDYWILRWLNDDVLKVYDDPSKVKPFCGRDDVEIEHVRTVAPFGGWFELESCEEPGEPHLRGLWLPDGNGYSVWHVDYGYVDEYDQFVEPAYHQELGKKGDEYDFWMPIPSIILAAGM